MAGKQSAKTRRYLEMHPPQKEEPAVLREVLIPAPAIAVPSAKAVMAALLADMKIERQTQADTWDAIKARHHGDPPVRAVWAHLADRRESVITMPSRVCVGEGYYD